MPRLSPGEYLQQNKSNNTTKSSVGTSTNGFNPSLYQQKKQAIAQQSVGAQVEGTNVAEQAQQQFGKFTENKKNLLGGALYGFSSVGRGIQSILSKGVDKITGTEGFGAPATKQQFQEDLGVNLSSGFGKTGEFIGETATYLTPGGVSMAPAKLGFRAGTAGLTESLAGQDIDRGTAVTAATAAFVPPAISKSLPIISGLLTNAAKGVGGFVGGKGSKVIEEIYKNPQAAREGLRGLATISDDAAKIRQGVSNIAKKASDEFADDLANLPKRLGRTPNVVTDKTKTTIKVDGKTYTLSKMGVKSQLTQALRQFDVTVDPKKKTFDFSEAPLDNAESKRLKEVFTTIDSWTDTTPVGFHKLARKIENFRKPGEQSAELNSIIDSVSRNVRGYITKRIPAAKVMLNKYSAAKDVIDAFDQEFATSGRFIGGTADRIKTERKLGNIFSGEKTTATEMLQSQIPQGSDMVGSQAGRLLQEPVPRNAAAIGDILRSAVNIVVTPKMVGETAAWLGTTAPKAERFLTQISKMEPASRAVLLNTISDLLE